MSINVQFNVSFVCADLFINLLLDDAKALSISQLYFKCLLNVYDFNHFLLIGCACYCPLWAFMPMLYDM